MNISFDVNKSFLRTILIATMSSHTSFSILFKIKDFYKITDVSKENLFTFNAEM